MSFPRGVPISAISNTIQSAAMRRPTPVAPVPAAPAPAAVAPAGVQMGSMNLAPLMQMLAAPTPQPPGLLGTSFNDPRSQANFAAAGALLQQGGYSATPTTLGQGLGAALQLRSQEMARQQALQDARRQRAITNAISIASIKPATPSAIDAKIAAGIRAGLSYEDAYKNAMSSTGTTVNLSTGAKGEQGLVDAFEKTVTGIDASNDLISKVNPLINLLEDGLATGFGQPVVVGVQRLLARINPEASQEMLNTIANSEEFAATLNTIILPQVKMLGVNPTDADLRFVKGGMADLSKTPQGNMVLLKMVALQEQRKMALDQAEQDYISENYLSEDPYKVRMGAAKARAAVRAQRPDLFGDDVVAKLRAEASAAMSAAKQNGPNSSIDEFTN